MKIIDEHTIQIDRDLSDLDLFVLEFVKIMEKYTPYTLVSGYVALLFGRSRNTEDVDMFITRITKPQFHDFYADLKNNGFKSVLVESEEELFSMLTDNLSVRFGKGESPIPNMEVKFVRDYLDILSLQSKMKVITKQGNLYISSPELQVAYKKLVLMSPKDMEDARHLQRLFEIPEENINKYQELFRRYGRL